MNKKQPTTMGITKINSLFRKFAPNVLEAAHISRFASQKVAVDISLFVHKYKIANGDLWLQGLLKLMVALRRHGIHPVVVFDGESPVEKTHEQAARREDRKRRTSRYQALTGLFSTYMTTGDLHPDLAAFYESQLIRRGLSTSSARSASTSSTEENIVIDPVFMKDRIENIRRQVVSFRTGDMKDVETLMDTLCIPHLQARYEAEGLCAWLNRRGLVTAVLTDDTDVFAYGAECAITRLNATTGACTLVYHAKILSQLGLTSDQFLDLCILCGCDYNTNVRGVGPIRAYHLIRTHGSIEQAILAQRNMDFTCLHHVRVREIFSTPPPLDDDTVPWCGAPTYAAIVQWMRSQGCVAVHPEVVFNACADDEKISKKNQHD